CLVLAPASFVSAQVTPIPGSGCPGASPVATQGNPSIGGRIAFDWQCGAREVPALAFGGILQPAISLPTSLTCTRVACILAVRPVVVVPGAPNAVLSVPVMIPNDPSLVGAAVGVQGLCVVPGREVCITLGQAISVQIMR